MKWARLKQGYLTVSASHSGREAYRDLFRLGPLLVSEEIASLPTRSQIEIARELEAAYASFPLSGVYISRYEGAEVPETLVGLGPPGVPWGGDLLLEHERVKSQLIAARREALSATRNAEYLEAQNEQQLRVISDLAEANRLLQAALIAKADGRVCLYEAREGAVTDQEGEELAVEFDTTEGPLEQVYETSRFIAGRVPRVGDELEAYVFVARKGKGPAPPPAADVGRKEDEFPSFRTKGVTGPIEL